jgi:hypothetical protein
MNWEAIGAVGESIGALAVVVSVVYLALQIRKQANESRLAAARELSTLYINCLTSQREDKELSSLYLKATQNYDDLPRDERFRVSTYIEECFRMFEQHFVHVGQRIADPIFIESINLSFQEWLTFPGIRRWWDLSKDMFVPQFRDHVDDLIEKAKIRGYSSTFKQQ